jgi:hypothetical protein
MNGHALRIYAHACHRAPLPRPRPTPSLALLRVVEHRETATALACELHLLAMLAATPGPGETIEVAYRRKEQQLAHAFAALGCDDARVLHRRLSEPRTDDELAQRFARLVVERRMRLLAILADAPRREARRR